MELKVAGDIKEADRHVFGNPFNGIESIGSSGGLHVC